MKNIGRRARSRAKDHLTSSRGLKNNAVFSKCARAHSPDYVIFNFTLTFDSRLILQGEIISQSVTLRG